MPETADIIHDADATPDAFAITPHDMGEHTCVVSLEGDIDLAAAPTMKSALMDLLGHGHRRFIVDLTRVRHLDSTGLGVLVGLRRRLADQGRLAIAGAPRNVLRVFQITGLDAKFEMFPSLDGALVAVRAPSVPVPRPC